MVKATNKNEATLFDRVAIGLFSAFLAAITALVIPFMFFAAGSIVPWPGIYLYGSVIFTIAMFVLGFLLKENYVVNMYGKIWNIFYRVFVG